MRILIPLLLLLTACAPTRSSGDDDDSPPDTVNLPDLRYGWSFGKCWGECRGDLYVSPDGDLAFQTTGWENETYLDITGTIHGGSLDAIDEAYAALDREALEAQYGCPDCADGGAEHIYFFDDLDPPSSVFEWGSPPPELADLQGLLRELALAMQSCDDGDGFDLIECGGSSIDGDDETDPDPGPPPPG